MLHSRQGRGTGRPRLRMWTLPVLVALVAACGTSTLRSQPPAPTADASSGAAVYETACAACHDGNVAQAPRREALSILPAARIEAALVTGIMRAQAAPLSLEERRAVSVFLSQVAPPPTGDKGRCTTAEARLLSQVKISDWGMDAGNMRAVDATKTGINAGNASKLKLAWVFAFPDAARARVQPTLAGDVLFTADQGGTI